MTTYTTVGYRPLPRRTICFSARPSRKQRTLHFNYIPLDTLAIIVASPTLISLLLNFPSNIRLSSYNSCSVPLSMSLKRHGLTSVAYLDGADWRSA